MIKESTIECVEKCGNIQYIWTLRMSASQKSIIWKIADINELKRFYTYC